MLIKRVVKSISDHELEGIFPLPKSREVRYKLFTPPLKAKGILAILPGCGMDNDDGYLDHIAGICVKSFGVAVALIDFHAIGSRLKTGAHLFMDNDDYLLAKAVFGENLITPKGLLIPRSNVQFSGKTNEQISKANDNYDQISKNLTKLNNPKCTLTMTMLCRDEGYQNFGVLSAMDIINALLDAKAVLSSSNALEKEAKITLCGTSHGAYLALLCAKFAPFLINLVIENSGYTYAHKVYCLGKRLNKMHPAYKLLWGEFNANIHTFTHNLYSIDPNDANYFSKDHFCIRDLSQGIKTYASFANTLIRSHHYTNDFVASYAAKNYFISSFKAYSPMSNLVTYTNETPLNPPFTKGYDHGMGMSLKQLLLRDYPNYSFLAPFKEIAYNGEFELEFVLEEHKYRFFLKNNFYDYEYIAI